MGIVGACAVDEDASLLQCVPDVAHDVALSFPTHLHIVKTPLLYAGRVFAKHAFARTGGIADDDIKCTTKGFEVFRMVVGHDTMAFTPFDDVLCQDVGTSALHLVGNE